MPLPLPASLGRPSRRYRDKALFAVSPIRTTRSFDPLPRTLISRVERLMSVARRLLASLTRSPAPYITSSSAWSRNPVGFAVSGASIRRSACSCDRKRGNLFGTRMIPRLGSGSPSMIPLLDIHLRKVRSVLSFRDTLWRT